MPIRSTRVFISNQTSETLYNLGSSLAHGAWTNDVEPPNTVAPGTIGYWESESDGIATGTEGNISFGIGDASKAGAVVSAVSRCWSDRHLLHRSRRHRLHRSLECSLRVVRAASHWRHVSAGRSSHCRRAQFKPAGRLRRWE